MADYSLKALADYRMFRNNNNKLYAPLLMCTPLVDVCRHKPLLVLPHNKGSEQGDYAGIPVHRPYVVAAPVIQQGTDRARLSSSVMQGFVELCSIVKLESGPCRLGHDGVMFYM